MMIVKVARFAALAAALLIVANVDAKAQSASIYQAILAEPNQKTQEVSTEQLKHILRDASAIVLDTRTRAEFDAGHIPGAHSLSVPPVDQLSAIERLVNGNKNAALVLYCNGPFCQSSRRLAEQLFDANFTNVRRYQLGIPIWRALGGPTAIELGGIKRVFGIDGTAVFIDGRSAAEFANGSLAGALNAPADQAVSGQLKVPLPEDDFNRRIVLFGRDGAQARELAEFMSKRPWHNVAYFSGAFRSLADAVQTK